MGEIRHAYTNAVADGTATSVVRPSDWNSGHAYTMQDGVSLGGNTAGVLAPISSGTLILAGGNNITLSQDGNSVTMLGAAGGLTTAMASNRGSDFIQATVGFNGTNISGTFGSNSISLSVAAPGLTTAMASNRGSDFVQAAAVFAGTNASGTIASGGVSVSVGNYITTAMASNRGSDFVNATAAFAGTSASGTIGSAGISVSIGPYITTADLSQNSTRYVQSNAAFAGTSASGTIASNGISVSIGPYITTADLSANSSKYVQNWKLTGNTAGTTSSAQGTDLWLAGGQGITLSGNSNSITLSVGSYITTGDLSQNSSKYVQNWKLTGNTAGTTSSAQGTDLWLHGSNNITLSGNSNSVVIAGWPHLSYYANVDEFVGTQTLTMQQSSSGMFPFVLPFPLSAAFIRLMESWNVAASSTGANTGNTLFSAGQTRSQNFVIYSRGAGANSMSLQYVTSTQFVLSQSINISAAVGSGQYSYSHRLTLPRSDGNFGLTKDYSSTAASINFHTSNLTDLTGTKQVDYPFAFSLSPGQYFLGVGASISTASQLTNVITRYFAGITHLGVSQVNNAIGTLGDNTNSSVVVTQGLGSFSTGAAAGTTSSVGLAVISSSASQNLLLFQFLRIT